MLGLPACVARQLFGLPFVDSPLVDAVVIQYRSVLCIIHDNTVLIGKKYSKHQEQQYD